MVHFALSDRSISSEEVMNSLRQSRVGAMVSFDGLVRNHNEGHYVKFLEYQAYAALAYRVGEAILREECERFGVLGASAVHRVGVLEVGQSAVFLAVSAEHRGEAFSAAAAIMERLKYELPIWKKETYADGSVEWVGPDQTNPLTGQIDHATPVWKASLKEIWISPGNDFRGHHGMPRGNHGIVSCEQIECVAGMGLRGDRYFGYKPDFKGQVTFLEESILQEIRSEFGVEPISASVLRRNLVVKGVRLRDWVGKRFVFQGVEFEGSEECKPCYWMDEAIAPGAEKFLMGDCRGGLRARILSNGILKTSAGEGISED